MANEILKLVPTMQSLSLLESNMKFAKKMKKPKKTKNGFVKQGMTNIVGVEMIKLQSGIIAGI